MVKPTIVFVPGLWEGPTVFSSCQSLLSSLSYPTEALSLVSTNSPSPNSPTMDDDTSSLASSLSRIVEGDSSGPREVLLVLHSAGGFLGSAAMKGLSVKERKEKGSEGGVKGILFLCAGIGPEGYKHEDRPFMDFTKEVSSCDPIATVFRSLLLEASLTSKLSSLAGRQDVLYCISSRTTLFSDFSDSEYSSLSPIIRDGFQPGSSGHWNSTTNHCGWRDVPCIYLITDGDKVLPPEVQEMMMGLLGEQCKKVLRTKAGHMVMLKEPEKVVELVKELEKLVDA